MLFLYRGLMTTQMVLVRRNWHTEIVSFSLSNFLCFFPLAIPVHKNRITFLLLTNTYKHLFTFTDTRTKTQSWRVQYVQLGMIISGRSQMPIWDFLYDYFSRYFVKSLEKAFNHYASSPRNSSAKTEKQTDTAHMEGGSSEKVRAKTPLFSYRTLFLRPTQITSYAPNNYRIHLARSIKHNVDMFSIAEEVSNNRHKRRR